MLYPLWAAISLAYFVVARVLMGRLKWREAGALASLTTWVVFTALMAGLVGWRDAGWAAALTVFLAWRHSGNLRRLASAA